jgi:flagellar motility protein MotE (MotC chaperone)
MKNLLWILIFFYAVNLIILGQDAKNSNINNSDKEGAIEFDPLSSSSEGEVKLLADLAKRRKELDLREKQINQQAMLLKATEKKIKEQLKTIDSQKKILLDILQQLKSYDENYMKDILDVFKNMKPKQAAAILDRWEIPLAKELIKKMNKRKAAAIIGVMNVNKAKDITSNIIKDLPKIKQQKSN